MSSRKRVKKLETGREVEGEAEQDAVQTAPPTRKKQSGTAGNQRRRKSGKLAMLLEMPIEIFTEVACYMSPEDLLNLSRTSMGLRQLLMSKSSKRVWEAARTLQNIPECPSDLSEPRYADLLFGKGCSFCPETRTRKVYSALRVRVCKICFDEKLVSDRDTKRVKKYNLSNDIFYSLYKMVPYIEIRPTHCNRYASQKFIKSDLIEVLDKIQELSSNKVGLDAYLKERQDLTRTTFLLSSLRKSKRQIDDWMQGVSQQKEELNEGLMDARRASIEERLRELGYGDDDLDSRYDKKGWKWRELMNQTRALTERVWQNIKPQLEATIRLRREEVASYFLKERRRCRLGETKKHFEESHPKLREVPFGTLVLWTEFEKLPAVKEFIEEDESRVPINEDRWLLLLASERLLNSLMAHAKTIEKDCLKKINDANAESFGVEKVEEVGPKSTTRDNLNPSRDQDTGWGEDYVPPCLLSATSLFQAKHEYKVESYSELLQRRSKGAFNRQVMRDWSNESYESSSPYVLMASRLLKHLQLPKETTMTYMLACGCTFRCILCSRTEGTPSMTWPQLVLHFVRQSEFLERLLRNKSEKLIDAPLRNDHDFSNSDNNCKVVARAYRQTVDMLPTSENADRYSLLSISWATKFPSDSGAFLASLDNESDEGPDATSEELLDHRTPCTFCVMLGDWYSTLYAGDLRRHMRNRHGTDIEGNLLPNDVI